MSLYKNKYRIESARLQGWDYSSPGYYFLTVCTHNRLNLFGDITNDKMYLNEFGRIVQDEWNKSFVIRRELLSDEFVVMPNHFHGIVRLIDIADKNNVNDVVETSARTSLRGGVINHCDTFKPDKTITHQTKQKPTTPRLCPKSISSFMAGVKSVITKRINKSRNTPGAQVLQYRFHDHIVRNEQELNRIRYYITNNPENWHSDKMNSGSGNIVMEPSTPYGEEIWMI